MRNDLVPGRGPVSRGGLTIRTLPVRRVFLGLLVLAGLVLLGWWVYVRFLQSDEDKIRNAILNAAQAARDRVPANVTGILSEDFQGPHRLGKAETHEVLSGLLLFTYRRIDVALGPDPIPVVLDPTDPNKARADFRAVVRGKLTDESEWLEIHPQAGGSRFQAAFKKIEKNWKMSSLSIME